MQHLPAHGVTLGLVGVQQIPTAPTGHRGREFPAEVGRILDAVFMPWPPAGEWQCAASPARKTRAVR